MTDDDLRSMLRSKAAEATVSDDAWDRIAMRLAEPAPSKVGRRAAVAGVAVAAAAATVFAANVPGTNVASPDRTTTSAASAPSTLTAPAPEGPAEPHVWAAPAELTTMREAAEAYVVERTGVAVAGGSASFEQTSDDAGTARFTGAGIETEVFLQRIDGRWVVDAAGSDLVPIHNPVYEGGELSAAVVAEAAGEIKADVAPAGEDLGEGGWAVTGPVHFREEVPVRATFESRYVTVGALLTLEDGTVALSETWVSDHNVVDPAVPTGEIVSVWPAVDDDGLRQLEADAEEGLRPDLQDPMGVAGGFLAELLPRDRSAQSYALGEFRQGDTMSGEVPYQIDGEPAGEVLLRRTRPGGIWHVTGVTSGLVELGEARLRGDVVTVDVDGAFDRYDALLRTPGGGVRRSSGPAPSTARFTDVEVSHWVQVVAYTSDRITGIAVVPVHAAG